MPRIEPRAAGWEARTLPLCYAAPCPTIAQCFNLTTRPSGQLSNKFWRPSSSPFKVGHIYKHSIVPFDELNNQWNNLGRGRWGHPWPPKRPEVEGQLLNFRVRPSTSAFARQLYFSTFFSTSEQKDAFLWRSSAVRAPSGANLINLI